MVLPSRRVAASPSLRSRASCCDTVGWRSAQHVLELGHRFLALAQQAQDHQSALVRERLEEMRSLARLRGHAVEIGRVAVSIAWQRASRRMRWSPAKSADYNKAPRTVDAERDQEF